MTAKRFFILNDEEYDDVESCIRDRTFKIKDIYGHYRYDDLEEICNELNRLNDENEQLKISLKDNENLIKICEKKFKELGYLITCDDNGYVIE